MRTSNKNFGEPGILHAGLLSGMLISTLLFAGCSGARGNGAISGSAKNGAASVSLEQTATVDGFSFEMGSMSGAGPGFQFVINNTGTTLLRLPAPHLMSPAPSRADGRMPIMNIPQALRPLSSGDFADAFVDQLGRTLFLTLIFDL